MSKKTTNWDPKYNRTPKRISQRRSTFHVEDVPKDLRLAFHAACLRAGTNMREAIKALMATYIAKHQEK